MKKGYYIYAYVHSIHGIVYIGQTVDVDKRIYQHDCSRHDNINRCHQDMLKESSVYYFSLNSKTHMNYMESLLIDRYKPVLNKKDKSEFNCNYNVLVDEWLLFRKGSSHIEISDLVHRSDAETPYYKLKQELDLLHQLLEYKDDVIKIRDDLIESLERDKKSAWEHYDSSWKIIRAKQKIMNNLSSQTLMYQNRIIELKDELSVLQDENQKLLDHNIYDAFKTICESPILKRIYFIVLILFGKNKVNNKFKSDITLENRTNICAECSNI